MQAAMPTCFPVFSGGNPERGEDNGSGQAFCEKQQEMLYNALEQIDQWYGIFTKEAEKYRESHKISYKENGEISYTEKLYPDDSNYSHHEFRPFKSINMLASANHSANQNFASRIIGYFNRTYNVSVPVPEIDGDTLKMGFRPHYMTYVDAVIEHLGGRSFRKTAEEELIKRFLQLVKPHRWSKVKPELKGDKISFPNIVVFDSFYYDFTTAQKPCDYSSHHGNISDSL